MLGRVKNLRRIAIGDDKHSSNVMAAICMGVIVTDWLRGWSLDQTLQPAFSLVDIFVVPLDVTALRQPPL